MFKTPHRCFVLAKECVAVAKSTVAALALLLCGVVAAQANLDFNPPDIKAIDGAGVNLVSGYPHPSVTTVSIGPKGRDLSHALSYTWGVGLQPDLRTDLWYGGVYTTFGNLSDSLGYPQMSCVSNASWTGAGIPVMVSAMGDSEKFCYYNGIFYSDRKRGSTLVKNVSGTYTFTTRDGTRYTADPSKGPSIFGCTTTAAITAVLPCAFFTSMVRPDGYQVDLNYETASVVLNGTSVLVARLRSVVSGTGYRLRFMFAFESTPDANSLTAWQTESGVVASNGAVDYCGVLSATCTYSRTWPTANFSADPGYNLTNLGDHGISVANSGGQTTTYTTTTFPPPTLSSSSYARITHMKAPTSATQETWSATYDNYIVCYSYGMAWQCSSKRLGLVKSVVTKAGTWNYSYLYEDMGTPTNNFASPVYYFWQTTSAGPNGSTLTARYNLKDGQLYSVWGTNGYANFSTDGTKRVLSAGDDEGRNYTFVYDDRGNTLEKHQVAAAGSGYPDLVISANYDTVCANQVTCNKPNWIRDANGNQTDFTYDPIHGGVLTKTLPAVLSGNTMVRPQTRYSYVQRYAWVKNSVGTMTRAATPIWVLDRESYCKTQGPNATNTGCAALNADGTSDEVVTQYDYGPDSGPNNLLLMGMTVTADGVTRRTCYGYNPLGNKISETTPNALLASCPGPAYN